MLGVVKGDVKVFQLKKERPEKYTVRAYSLILICIYYGLSGGLLELKEMSLRVYTSPMGKFLTEGPRKCRTPPHFTGCWIGLTKL